MGVEIYSEPPVGADLQAKPPVGDCLLVDASVGVKLPGCNGGADAAPELLASVPCAFI